MYCNLCAIPFSCAYIKRLDSMLCNFCSTFLRGDWSNWSWFLKCRSNFCVFIVTTRYWWLHSSVSKYSWGGSVGIVLDTAHFQWSIWFLWAIILEHFSRFTQVSKFHHWSGENLELKSYMCGKCYGLRHVGAIWFVFHVLQLLIRFT